MRSNVQQLAAVRLAQHLMEQLSLSRPEYQLLTDGTLGLHGIYGYASLADAAALIYAAESEPA